MDVSGVSLVTAACSEKELEGNFSVVYCVTVRPKVGAEPEGGSRVRETASEREACE